MSRICSALSGPCWLTAFGAGEPRSRREFLLLKFGIAPLHGHAREGGNIERATWCLSALVWLVSCATDPAAEWSKEGFSSEEYRADSTECHGRAKAVASVMRTPSLAEVKAKAKLKQEAFEYCLETKGYSRRGETFGRPGGPDLPQDPLLRVGIPRSWELVAVQAQHQAADFAIGFHGSRGIAFAGSCRFTRSDGSSVEKTIVDTVPRSYKFRGRGLDCEIEKRSAHGVLRIQVLKDRAVIVHSMASAANARLRISAR